MQARLRMKNSLKVLYYGEMGKSSCNNSFVLFCFFADAEKEMITFCAECSARIRISSFFCHEADVALFAVNYDFHILP